MTRLRRLRLAISEDLATPGGIWLGLRMLGWALALPVLKHVLPIGRLARLMWSDSHRRDRVSPARVPRLAQRISGVIPYPSRDNCLERSLLAYRFLSMAGEDPRLVLGVNASQGNVRGHAWLTLNGRPVFDETGNDYPPLVVFGPKGERRELTAAV